MIINTGRVVIPTLDNFRLLVNFNNTHIPLYVKTSTIFALSLPTFSIREDCFDNHVN
jgi:hypothetical protein